MNMRTSAVMLVGLWVLGCSQAIPQTASGPPRTREALQNSTWVQAARKHNIEPLSLYSIAFQESRRPRPDGWLRPWPWTLHTPSHGAQYFDSYEAALEAFRTLIAKGVTNIDVGLMQINWGWHSHRQPDPAKLLLPNQNIEIGAAILRELLDRFEGDLRLALAHYHSSTLERGLPYAASVLTILEHFQQLDSITSALASENETAS